jgi:hypothetical protein
VAGEAGAGPDQAAGTGSSPSTPSAFSVPWKRAPPPATLHATLAAAGPAAFAAHAAGSAGAASRTGAAALAPSLQCAASSSAIAAYTGPVVGAARRRCRGPTLRASTASPPPSAGVAGPRKILASLSFLRRSAKTDMSRPSNSPTPAPAPAPPGTTVAQPSGLGAERKPSESAGLPSAGRTAGIGGAAGGGADRHDESAQGPGAAASAAAAGDELEQDRAGSNPALAERVRRRLSRPHCPAASAAVAAAAVGAAAAAAAAAAPLQGASGADSLAAGRGLAGPKALSNCRTAQGQPPRTLPSRGPQRQRGHSKRRANTYGQATERIAQRTGLHCETREDQRSS